MAANKSEKPKSEAEKKFEDLLNDKCSWTYKSIKTIKCQRSGQNDENGPVLQIRTVNIEETAYNHPKNTASSFDEYDYVESDTKKKAKKNTKQSRKSRSSKTAQLDSKEWNLNTSKPKERFDKSAQMSTSKRNKRNLKNVSYAESDSSSDDGLVLLSRRYDERMANGCGSNDHAINSTINEIPQASSSNICADESNYLSDVDLEISRAIAENYAEMNNSKADVNQNSEFQNYDEIIAPENKTQFGDQNSPMEFWLNDDDQNCDSSQNSIEDKVPEKEIAASASESLSSLSECDNNKREEKKEKDKAAKNESVNNKNDQNSEILQQFMTISTEVQEVCNELEATNDDEEEDELVNDFFSGNFDVEKYRAKLSADKPASLTTEKSTNSINKFELPKTSPVYSPKTYSDSGIRTNEKNHKRATKNSDDAKYTKENRKESNSKMSLMNENQSVVRYPTKVKEQHTFSLDTDHEVRKEGIEDSLMHTVIDSPRTYSNSSKRSNEKIHKRTNRNSDNAIDTKEKSKKSGKETKPKDQKTSNVNYSLKEKYNICFDSSSSGLSSEDEAEDSVFGGNGNSIIHSVIDSPKTYSGSRIQSNEIRKKYTNKNLDNAKDTKGKCEESDNKINSKNKNTSNARRLKKVKEQHGLHMDSDRTSSEQNNEDEAENDTPEENEYFVIDEYFKENSFDVQEKNRKMNKIVRKRDETGKRKSDTKSEQNVKNINTRQFLGERDTKFTFPEKCDVAQQSVTSKTETKENTSLGNVKDGGSAKCTKKKAPKTWEDLEADILNREEQISFLPLFETDLSPIHGIFLKDEKLHPRRKNKNRPSSHGPEEKLETSTTKTQNKWAVVKSGQGNSGQIASRKNDVTFDSPNASIIDRVIRRMQMCTSPVLTPNKEMPQMVEHLESPILTEYTYSVQETKSVFFTTEKKPNEKQTRQSNTAYKEHAEKNVVQKNYRFCKKREIKTVIDPNGASITNQTSVKLNEIPKKKNMKLSKSSESDNDSLLESNENSEIKNSTPELDKSPSFPEDTLASNEEGSYNLRKRKCKDNAYRQNPTKKRSTTKVNNETKSSITKCKGSKSNQQHKQNKSPFIEKPTRENTITENPPFINKRKRSNKNNFKNIPANNTNESEPEDLFQNGASSQDSISDRQDRYLEKRNSNFKAPKTSNEGMSSQTEALSTIGNPKTPVQGLQKQVYNAKKSMKAERPRRDSKEEYEKYLQKLFGEDMAEEFNIQWEILDGTNETSGKNLQMKDDGNYSGAKELLTQNSDEELFSLSSDTESEVETPSPRRAAGLLADVFN